MTKVVIYGHSHVWSVRRALGSFEQEKVSFEVPICGTKEFPGDLLYKNEKEQVRLNPVITSVINRYSGSAEEASTWLVSMAQGNYYNQFGMLAEHDIFDFVSEELPSVGLVSDAVYIPYGAVKSAMESRMATFFKYLQVMAKSSFGNRFIVVGPPPPIKEDFLIEQTLEGEEKNILISPRSVRLKLWYLQNNLARSYCRQLDVSYINGGLEGSQDNEGYLLDEYVKDSVHANHFYSKKLLERLERYVLNLKEDI